MDALFDKSPVPMWMYDRESLRFVAVNDAAVHDYGYAREEFLAMTIADIRPAEDLAALRDDVAAAAGLSANRLWRHRRKDGTIVSVDVRANDLELDGRPVRLVVALDVTDRERARDQLRHAQKMDAIGQLAGGVAHDFNNILTVIGAYARLVEDALDDNDRRGADVIEIRRAAERGTRITRQLLAVSRHSIVSPRPIDVDAAVAELAPMLRRLVGEGVKLVVVPGGALPCVYVDPSQLEQVLLNLCVNARDAMPDGGRITVEAQRQELDPEAARLRGVKPGHYVAIAITDTGVGMSLDTQRRVFDPFFTTKEAGKGTGLGLSIVHGIVAQAGGAVSVYSELGHGSTFRVLLPVTDEAAAEVPAPMNAAPAALPPITVLVIDDEADVRGVAARILADAGCRVLEASSAQEARRVCVHHDGAIEAIVADVVLTDGRGEKLVEELRVLRPNVATILVSGYPAGALSAQGTLPRDLLPKPFSPQELRAAVARALGSNQAIVEGRGTPRRGRVLVADDDTSLRKLIGRILRRAEYDVVEVVDGAGALAAVAEGPFEVVIGDVHMPHASGLDLLRAVRRVDLDVPVILMSGQPDVASAQQAIELGAFRYISKPFDIEALAKTVQLASRAHVLARLRRDAIAPSHTQLGAADRAGLEVRFEKALDGMWMAYQPIFDARTGALYGVEALMRSREPSMPTPNALLDAATLLDRLPQLGRRVRELAAAGLDARTDEAAWFVNLHPAELADADLIDPSAPLARMSHRVVLEITERAALDHTPDLAARLARLRELGYRVAVDDIGAGYSSLASFAELTPEIVKIDMSLVRDVHLSAAKQRVVSALCSLAHEVGSLVVAEGIETQEERECVASLGCDLLQGFLLGRPTTTPQG